MKNELNGKLVTVDEEIKNLEGQRLQPQKGFFYHSSNKVYLHLMKTRPN